MGDEAEAVFEMVYGKGFEAYGLRRPKVSLRQVPPFVRFTPDYLTSDGLIEVQGFGQDQVCKFKVGKLSALEEWNAQFGVTFFLYDKTNQRFGYISLGPLMELLPTKGTLTTFPEGTPYWAVPADELPVVWTDL